MSVLHYKQEHQQLGQRHRPIYSGSAEILLDFLRLMHPARQRPGHSSVGIY